ncbi:MAG: Haloalkane dehalogenase [Gemmatimonadaceae bacterium]|nr:Haloalkane dehalogenase [Gemmatimonadaceae bacterium]
MASCTAAVLLAVACARNTGDRAPAPIDSRSHWIDAAGHTNVRIPIGGTLLHYVDYGGNGLPVVFLAGMGNSAHVFDEFAPRFTDRHRVLAFTRRGFGESGQPGSGYDTKRLGDDVRDLLDSLSIPQAVLVGHSVGGDELTDVGARFPERVAGLVYLDAAYDRAGVTGRLLQQLLLGQLPPKAPRANGPDRSSVVSFREYLERIYGVPWPESEVRATRVFSNDGHYVGDVTPARINLAVARGETAMRYERLTAPILAIYAVDRTVDRDYPWIRRMVIGQGKANLQAEKAIRAQRRWERDGRSRLAAARPHARIVELRNASHYLFISNADTVEFELRKFLRGLPSA